jgi:hypothetical protein
MKGLIKLTAAGVKVRQAQPDGARRHAGRAAEHFQQAGELAGRTDFGGFRLADLIDFASHVKTHAADWLPHADEVVAVVFDRFLMPE